MKPKLSGGLVHELPKDLAIALSNADTAAELWQKLMPIARNEFICWVVDAKREQTRTKRIAIAVEQLLEGKRRPCCWPGCLHRTDKKPGEWQQNVLIDKKVLL